MKYVSIASGKDIQLTAKSSMLHSELSIVNVHNVARYLIRVYYIHSVNTAVNQHMHLSAQFPSM